MNIHSRAQPPRVAEDRFSLFEMIAALAMLAGGQGDEALATMLIAVVRAYR